MWCSCILRLVSAVHPLSRGHLWHCSHVRMFIRRIIPAFFYLSCLNTILFLLSLPSSRRTGCEERGYTRIITIESKREPPQYILGTLFCNTTHASKSTADGRRLVLQRYDLGPSTVEPSEASKCNFIPKTSACVLQNAAPMFQQTFHFLESITRHTARLGEEDKLNSISIESRCGDSAPRIDNFVCDLSCQVWQRTQGFRKPYSMVPCS
jgi:hypothetical protein